VARESKAIRISKPFVVVVNIIPYSTKGTVYQMGGGLTM
jgi:hypothetical protein